MSTWSMASQPALGLSLHPVISQIRNPALGSTPMLTAGPIACALAVHSLQGSRALLLTLPLVLGLQVYGCHSIRDQAKRSCAACKAAVALPTLDISCGGFGVAAPSWKAAAMPASS
jgi:hypothetical protein